MSMPFPFTDRNPYLEGIFAPVKAETSATDLPVIGRLPDDLAGMFIRNGSNPRFSPIGRYHWFDGDGMVHGLQFEGGRASYRNRYVRTEALAAEEAAGQALSKGILESPDFRRKGGPFKDTANTDLTFHDGKLLALWWLGGACYEIALPSLDTVGIRDFKDASGAGLRKGLSAHPKIDPKTGEMMFFDHSITPPHLTYGVISATGQIVNKIDVDLPGARLQHDMAITEHHSILFDFPLLWDPELLARGKTRVRFNRDLPARFGILPRMGKASDIRWFEASSCYMYHSINAWESGDEIILVGCRIENPLPGPENRSKPLPRLDILELEPYLHEWRFNLVTGAVTERKLDDVMTEFPRMNNEVLGRPSHYSYNPRIAPAEELLYDGVIKYDTDSGAKWEFVYGEGRYGGETTFAPARGAKSEDDGYVLTFLHDLKEDRSELLVFDAKAVSDGPVARVLLPSRVPAGYHSWWVDEARLNASAI